LKNCNKCGTELSNDNWWPSSQKSYNYTCNEFINNLITKLTEYPITDVAIDNIKEPELHEKYREVLSHYIQIKK